MVEGPGPQFPLVVISEEAIAKANEFLAQSGSPITDQASANATGLRLQEITKFEAQVEANRKVVKAPVVELGRLIDEKAKQALIPLAEAKAKDKANLDKYVREQNELVAKAAKEAQDAINARIKAEEEALKKGEVLEPVVLPPVVIPQPVKIAGVKIKPTLEYEILEFAKVPDMYKVIDEKMLKTAIEQNKVTEKDAWIKISWVDKSQSSGRR